MLLLTITVGICFSGWLIALRIADEKESEGITLGFAITTCVIVLIMAIFRGQTIPEEFNQYDWKYLCVRRGGAIESKLISIPPGYEKGMDPKHGKYYHTCNLRDLGEMKPEELEKLEKEKDKPDDSF